MVAQEIDDKMSVIEGAHAKDLMKLGESQKEETAKMERVLGSMKETKAEVEGQLRKKKEAVAALELSILDLQAGVTDLSKRVQSAEAEAEAEITASDAEITTKKSQAVSKTTTLQTQAETDNAEASQAQADLRDLGDKLSGARSRKNESLNRVEASEKNVSPCSHDFAIEMPVTIASFDLASLKKNAKQRLIPKRSSSYLKPRQSLFV